MRDRIEIEKDIVPYSFNILLADEWFELYVNYNENADLFTVSLYKEDTLVCTEPVVYGQPLFKDLYQPGEYPAIDIVPLDESGIQKTVTFLNMGETVFLTVDDEGDGEDEERDG